MKSLMITWVAPAKSDGAHDFWIRFERVDSTLHVCISQSRSTVFDGIAKGVETSRRAPAPLWTTGFPVMRA